MHWGRDMGWLRRVGGGLSLLALGLAVGFIGGLLRRRTPTHYVSDRHAPPADH